MHQPDDAIALLTTDHRQVRALFQQYEDTPDPYLKQIIAEHVFAELTLHMLLEESVFYPAVAEQADEEGKRLVREALQDHQQLRDLIATLQDVEEDAAFEARFQAMREHVEQHIEDEETTMFPQAAQVLATHLEEITVLLQERKAQILAS
jgi:hemerythrin-like domain-containing protein